MQRQRQRSSKFLGTLALVLILGISGCASAPPPDQRSEIDPWEPLNRSVFGFNRALDKATTKPLAKGYRKIVPEPLKKGVSNFFRNLSTPASVVNNFLQAKPEQGLSELGRFLFNSTVGIGGLFDVATAGGIADNREDFGQTAAVWGIPDGPYFMLPIMGPSTVRDTLLLPLRIISSPLYSYKNSSFRGKLTVLRIVDIRYRLLVTDKFLDESKDPYVTLRESYLQNREYEIFDGAPPEDDDFFDEFFDEE